MCNDIHLEITELFGSTCLLFPNLEIFSAVIFSDVSSFSFFFLFFVFLGPHPRHMEVPKLGVKSEL